MRAPLQKSKPIEKTENPCWDCRSYDTCHETFYREPSPQGTCLQPSCGRRRLTGSDRYGHHYFRDSSPYDIAAVLAVRQRFVNRLPTKPYCSRNVKLPEPTTSIIREKEQALWCGHIQLTKHFRSFIVLDLDYKNAAQRVGIMAALGEIPQPTIICETPATGRCQVFYELQAPVWFPKNGKRGKRRQVKPRVAPQAFYRRVKAAMVEFFSADPNHHHLCKNPLHRDWATSWSDSRYSLSELAQQFGLAPSFERGAERPAYLPEERSRNCKMFDWLRFYAYDNVDYCNSESGLFDSLERYANSCNPEFDRWSEGQIGRQELLGIVRSVAKWTWRERGNFQDMVCRGIMELSPIPLMEASARAEEVERRKRAGGKFARQRVQEDSIRRIQEAVKQLQEKELVVSIAAISRLSGLHRNTVGRNRSAIVNPITAACAPHAVDQFRGGPGRPEPLTPEAFLNTSDGEWREPRMGSGAASAGGKTPDAFGEGGGCGQTDDPLDIAVGLVECVVPGNGGVSGLKPGPRESAPPGAGCGVGDFAGSGAPPDDGLEMRPVVEAGFCEGPGFESVYSQSPAAGPDPGSSG